LGANVDDSLTVVIAGLLGAAAACLLGWALRRRKAEPEDVTLGFLGPSLAALYLLVLALSVAAEWGTISDAHQGVTTEASAVRELYWSSNGLPASAGATIRTQAREYATAVVDHDWPLMRRGTLDDQTLNMLSAMESTVLKINPANAAASTAQEDALNQLGTLATARAQREDDAAVRLPIGVLAAVVATSVVMALFPFAVGIRPTLPSIMLASTQAALVTIGVVVVFQLNHAYSGPLAVQPDALTAFIHQIGGAP
jgi:hypothetical protein